MPLSMLIKHNLMYSVLHMISLCTQHNRSADTTRKLEEVLQQQFTVFSLPYEEHTTSLPTAIPVHTFTQFRQVRYIQPL